jgi:hypothetical protein
MLNINNPNIHEYIALSFSYEVAKHHNSTKVIISKFSALKFLLNNPLSV